MPVSELENKADKMMSSNNMPNSIGSSREFNGVQLVMDWMRIITINTLIKKR
jgi:hypothetical protein